MIQIEKILMISKKKKSNSLHITRTQSRRNTNDNEIWAAVWMPTGEGDRPVEPEKSCKRKNENKN